MKITKRLLPLFLIIIAVVLGIGCTNADKTDVEEVIVNELDLLKNLDSEATLKYISYKELFPDAKKDTELSPEVKEVFSLFFQDFDYKILDIDVDSNKMKATAVVKLSTLDARTLARDYAAATLESEIKEAAAHPQNTQDSTDSLMERYITLNHLLKTNEYDTVEQKCTMVLNDEGDSKDKWIIKRSHSLENDLVGGLMTYLSDPDILSAEDTLAVYLKTLKKMNMEEMSNYLGVESILNTSDSAKSKIASALVEQVHKNFNFEFKEVKEDGYRASVETVITTFNSDAILTAYQKELDTYLASTEAVIDGYEKRYEKAHELLQKHIVANEETVTDVIVFHLVNDGACWRLSEDGTEFGNVIFGTLSSTPEEE